MAKAIYIDPSGKQYITETGGPDSYTSFQKSGDNGQIKATTTTYEGGDQNKPITSQTTTTIQGQDQDPSQYYQRFKPSISVTDTGNIQVNAPSSYLQSQSYLQNVKPVLESYSGKNLMDQNVRNQFNNDVATVFNPSSNSWYQQALNNYHYGAMDDAHSNELMTAQIAANYANDTEKLKQFNIPIKVTTTVDNDKGWLGGGGDEASWTRGDTLGDDYQMNAKDFLDRFNEWSDQQKDIFLENMSKTSTNSKATPFMRGRADAILSLLQNANKNNSDYKNFLEASTATKLYNTGVGAVQGLSTSIPGTLGAAAAGGADDLGPLNTYLSNSAQGYGWGYGAGMLGGLGYDMLTTSMPGMGVTKAVGGAVNRLGTAKTATQTAETVAKASKGLDAANKSLEAAKATGNATKIAEAAKAVETSTQLLNNAQNTARAAQRTNSLVQTGAALFGAGNAANSGLLAKGAITFLNNMDIPVTASYAVGRSAANYVAKKNDPNDEYSKDPGKAFAKDLALNLAFAGGSRLLGEASKAVGRGALGSRVASLHNRMAIGYDKTLGRLVAKATGTTEYHKGVTAARQADLASHKAFIKRQRAARKSGVAFTEKEPIAQHYMAFQNGLTANRNANKILDSQERSEQKYGKQMSSFTAARAAEGAADAVQDIDEAAKGIDSAVKASSDFAKSQISDEDLRKLGGTPESNQLTAEQKEQAEQSTNQPTKQDIQAQPAQQIQQAPETSAEPQAPATQPEAPTEPQVKNPMAQDKDNPDLKAEDGNPDAGKVSTSQQNKEVSAAADPVNRANAEMQDTIANDPKARKALGFDAKGNMVKDNLDRYIQDANMASMLSKRLEWDDIVNDARLYHSANLTDEQKARLNKYLDDQVAAGKERKARYLSDSTRKKYERALEIAKRRLAKNPISKNETATILANKTYTAISGGHAMAQYLISKYQLGTNPMSLVDLARARQNPLWSDYMHWQGKGLSSDVDNYIRKYPFIGTGARSKGGYEGAMTSLQNRLNTIQDEMIKKQQNMIANAMSKGADGAIVQQTVERIHRMDDDLEDAIATTNDLANRFLGRDAEATKLFNYNADSLKKLQDVRGQADDLANTALGKAQDTKLSTESLASNVRAKTPEAFTSQPKLSTLEPGQAKKAVENYDKIAAASAQSTSTMSRMDFDANVPNMSTPEGAAFTKNALSDIPDSIIRNLPAREKEALQGLQLGRTNVDSTLALHNVNIRNHLEAKGIHGVVDANGNYVQISPNARLYDTSTSESAIKNMLANTTMDPGNINNAATEVTAAMANNWKNKAFKDEKVYAGILEQAQKNGISPDAMASKMLASDGDFKKQVADFIYNNSPSGKQFADDMTDALIYARQQYNALYAPKPMTDQLGKTYVEDVIPVKDLVRDTNFQPRTTASGAGTTESVFEKGYQEGWSTQPIVVQRMPGGKYRVLGGHSRTMGLEQRAKAGLDNPETIRARVYEGLSDAEAHQVARAANQGPQYESGLDMAKSISESMAAGEKPVVQKQNMVRGTSFDDYNYLWKSIGKDQLIQNAINYSDNMSFENISKLAKMARKGNITEEKFDGIINGLLKNDRFNNKDATTLIKFYSTKQSNQAAKEAQSALFDLADKSDFGSLAGADIMDALHEHEKLYKDIIRTRNSIDRTIKKGGVSDTTKAELEQALKKQQDKLDNIEQEMASSFSKKARAAEKAPETTEGAQQADLFGGTTSTQDVYDSQLEQEAAEEATPISENQGGLLDMFPSGWQPGDAAPTKSDAEALIARNPDGTIDKASKKEVERKYNELEKERKCGQ